MTRIIYLQFTNPGGYPPLEHSSAILAEAGAEVLVLGTTAAGTNRMAWPARAGVTVEIMPKRERGIGHKIDYLRFVANSVRAARRVRPQWVYASDSLTAPIALLVCWLLGTRIVYHEHDEPFAPNASWLTRLMLRARNHLARVAEAVVVPNAGRGERLRRSSGRRDQVLIVWNCPRRSEIRANGAMLTGPMRLIYQGSIARERVPLSLVEAVARVPGVELVVVGYEVGSSKGHLDDLRREARCRGVADRLHIMGAISRSSLLEITAQCHVGLSFMPAHSGNPNEAMMVGSSNKAFEYLACGLALLVSDVAEWRETFVSAGVARACDPADVDSLESAVRWYADHRRELLEAGQAGQARIEDDWNYEFQFAPVQRVILGQWHAAPRVPLADELVSKVHDKRA